MSRLACTGIGLAIGLGWLPLHALSLAAPPPEGPDAHLVLYSDPHKELVEVRYRGPKGTFDASAMQQIAHVMRSPDGEAGPIDPRLVALVDQIQDHFGADTVEIISGYRSSAYNRGLRKEGHHVAKESLHMRGLAADIHLDEISERAVRDYAVSLRRGGVGYYPSLHFVHVDLGPVRQWEEPEGPRKIIGQEANTSPCQATTDRNYYLPPAFGPGAGRHTTTVTVTVTVSGPPSACALADALPIRFDRFRRGVWQDDGVRTTATLKKMPRPCLEEVCTDYAVRVESRVWGKYRLRVRAPGEDAIFSNEFYLKKE